jgi:hypothetical protein
MFKSSAFVARIVTSGICFLSLTSLESGQHALAQTLHAGRDTTIQQAIADAHTYPADRWVTILVAPGDYYGPVIIDRPKTRLIALSSPIVRNRVLVGHNPRCSIHPPSDGILGTLSVTVDDVEIRGFDVDGDSGTGISAYGVPYVSPGTDPLDQQIRGVTVTGNVVTNAFAAIGLVQASAVVRGNTSVDFGHAGIVASGGPVSRRGVTVNVVGNVFSGKDIGGVFIGAIDVAAEFPRTDGPPGLLKLTASDNDFSDNGNGIVLAMRGALPLSEEPGVIAAAIRGNRIRHTYTGLVVQSYQCLLADACQSGRPGSAVEALLVDNDLAGTATTAYLTFQLPTFAPDGSFVGTGVYLNGSTINLKTIRTDLRDFSYDNPAGGNSLIVNGQSYIGTR